MTKNQYLANKFKQAKSILNKLKIPYSKKIKKIVASAMSEELGLCTNFPEDDSYIIEINEDLVDVVMKTKKQSLIDSMMGVILHEMMHTCEGCLNHSPLWHEYVDLVNENYGYHISTVTSADDKEIVDILCKDYKYAITCQKCGFSFYYKRNCPAVKNCESYHCSYCGGELKRSR